MIWGAFFLRSFLFIRDSIRPEPIQDKKMVDGKGGSLKTIHHYKTERGLINAPPFRFFPYGGWSGGIRKHPPIFKAKADQKPITASVQLLFRKKKSHALVRAVPCLRFCVLFRNALPHCLLILSKEKIILVNPPGVRLFFFPLAAVRSGLLIFPFHQENRSLFQWPHAVNKLSTQGGVAEPRQTFTSLIISNSNASSQSPFLREESNFSNNIIISWY